MSTHEHRRFTAEQKLEILREADQSFERTLMDKHAIQSVIWSIEPMPGERRHEHEAGAKGDSGEYQGSGFPLENHFTGFLCGRFSFKHQNNP